MNDELLIAITFWVSVQALSPEELKAAHRDLAKVLAP